MDNTGQDRDLAFEEGFEKVLLYIEEKNIFGHAMSSSNSTLSISRSSSRI